MAQKLDADLNIIQNSDIEVQIDPLTKDLNIIQKLDDEPNDVGGLSAAELKAKFDEAGNIIKDFINDSLIPQVTAESVSEKQREANEQQRQDNEAQRQANEQVRQEQEAARESAETARSVWENYDPAKAYAPGNKVYWAGSSYVNKSPCTGVAPNFTENWQMVAKRGETVGSGMTEEDADGRYLQLSGGSLTGPLTVQEPTQAANPVTKGYFEQNIVRPQIVVTTEDGATVTCSKGTVTFQETAAGGTAVFNVTDFGDWILSAEKDGEQSAPATVSVETVKQYAVTVAFEPPEPPVHIYGASWNGTSTTKWTRTDAAADFTDPVPYVDGASSYGSPFDNLQPWAGMTTSERTGGVMVAIPKFWYKLTQSGAGLNIQIADGPVDGFSASPAHMDRGDGEGERDVVYVGRYHCGSDSKSNSGQTPKTGVTRANFRLSIHALGSNIWQMDFATRFTLWLLYLVEFADWNTQKTIGNGCGNSGTPQNMGYTDFMPYHTGTTQSSRNTYGLGTQYRNIEGLWDNVYDLCDGCYNNSDGLNIILNPYLYSDSRGGTSVGTPVRGWPSAFNVSNQAGFQMIIPSAVYGGGNVGSCDFWNFSPSSPEVFVGGFYSQNDEFGLFFVGCSAATVGATNIGSRLMELPNAA